MTGSTPLNSGPVPPSQSLSTGQWDKTENIGTILGTAHGTSPLKALAYRVLRRDRQRDNSRDKPIPLVSHSDDTETDKWDTLERWAEFEERAAILEHDGGMGRSEAEQTAVKLLLIHGGRQ